MFFRNLEPRRDCFGMDAALLASTRPAAFRRAGQVGRSVETQIGQPTKPRSSPSL